MLKSWNPDWKPPYFMTDSCDVEIAAIELTFTNCKVFKCDFHREQVWERWIKEKKHGLSNEDGSLLLTLLRKCAIAPTYFKLQEVNHNYQEAVKILKEMEILKKNKCIIGYNQNATGMNNICVIYFYVHNSDWLKLIWQQIIMQQ